MHMIRKKDLNVAEMDTWTKSCSPTIVITDNGEVQMHEEATVYVKELVKFLTMKMHLALATPSLLRPILKFWSIGVALMKFTLANISERRIWVSNVSVTYNGFREFYTSDLFPHV